jgi:ABC-type phosphate/phosphonate transport system substrate-binding protein
MKPILVGAVLYDPKVSVIWDIIREFFENNGCPMDAVFYTNYELMVRALVQRHIDIAWNSPLAWLDSQRLSGGRCRAIAMRDTDRDRVSYFVAKKTAGFKALKDLKGATLAVGAKDSPQATLIPIGALQQAGMAPDRDFQVRRFDVLVGKHGDHIGGELEAFHCLEKGGAEASTMLDLNWKSWAQDGTVNPTDYAIVAATVPYDHCNFTVLDEFPLEREKQWLDVLFSMRYDNPEHQKMMDMEGLKQWVPGRTSGYAALQDAVDRQRFFDEATD